MTPGPLSLFKVAAKHRDTHASCSGRQAVHQAFVRVSEAQAARRQQRAAELRDSFNFYSQISKRDFSVEHSW